MNTLRWIILGPTNAWKTTILDTLENQYHIHQISLGKLTRNKELNPIYQEILEKCIQNKLPVPSDIGPKAILPFIENFTKNNENYCIDGIPRSLEEAKIFEQICSQTDLSHNFILSLQVNYKTLISRIKTRLQESDREEDLTNYNIRLEQYYAEYEKIIDFFNNKIPIYHLDASYLNKQQVQEKVIQILNIQKPSL